MTMLMLSLQRAKRYHTLHLESNRSVYDILGKNGSKAPGDGPYKEEFYLMFVLRAMDSSIYFLLGLLFLASFLLNCKNLRRLHKRGHGFLPEFKTVRDGRRFFGPGRNTRLEEVSTVM